MLTSICSANLGDGLLSNEYPTQKEIKKKEKWVSTSRYLKKMKKECWGCMNKRTLSPYYYKNELESISHIFYVSFVPHVFIFVFKFQTIDWNC